MTDDITPRDSLNGMDIATGTGLFVDLGVDLEAMKTNSEKLSY